MMNPIRPDEKDTGCCNGSDLDELVPGGGAREFEDPEVFTE